MPAKMRRSLTLRAACKQVGVPLIALCVFALPAAQACSPAVLVSPAQAAVAPAQDAAGILDLRAHHVTLSVSNIDVERSWYRDKLGFVPGKHTEHGTDLEVWQLNLPGYRMDLVRMTGSQRPKTPTPDYQQQGWAHIAFTAANLPKALEFLKASSTDVKPSFDEHQVLTKLTVHDPEGNQIEIFPR